MVDDVLSLDKFHIVDLSRGLHPLEPVLFRELHPTSHHLIPLLDQGILSESWVVTDADEAVFRKGFCLCPLAFTLLIIEVRRVKVSLIVVTITSANVEDGALARSPLQVAAVPGVLLTV